jgi:hypothetical protein
MALSKDDILKAQDQILEEVYVPEWGGSVFIRSMTGVERDAFEASNFQKDRKGGDYQLNMTNIRARLLSLTICDDKGVRLFEDAGKLGGKSAKVLARLFEMSQRLSGITKEDVEDMAKNSEPVPSDIS